MPRPALLRNPHQPRRLPPRPEQNPSARHSLDFPPPRPRLRSWPLPAQKSHRRPLSRPAAHPRAQHGSGPRPQGRAAAPASRRPLCRLLFRFRLLARCPHTGSFPSTHTAVYWSLFLPLALAFPRHRLPLLVFPVLIGLGRLALDMHYLSDVLFSIWLVVLFTFLAGRLAQLPALAGPAPASSVILSGAQQSEGPSSIK
ncbi:phosphatase PAP2 family protein [Hymenobacter cellulosilyticus]|uniref:phosphatase PAP2 family protein n=1 Tax=Hymenobacter cellulosilyticus TaxID=2932248 RepID=UPI0035CBB5FE